MKYLAIEFNISGANDTLTLQNARDVIAALAGTAGCESFVDTDNGIIGYADTNVFDEDSLKNMMYNFPIEGCKVDFLVKEAEYRDWNKDWENTGFEPIAIAERCIIHDLHHSVQKSYPIDITIDARQAFGTGTHETTKMIVGKLLDMNMKEKRVLDCGCGTGILSIVALKCGADYALGYDIDEWSVKNAMHNAELNGVKKFKAIQGDSKVIDTDEVAINNDCIIDDEIGSFNIVLANINRNILLHDMNVFVKRMTEKATLILSGFYEEDVPLLTDCTSRLGLTMKSKTKNRDWCCITLEKVRNTSFSI